MKRNLRNKHLFILFAILCLTGCTAKGNNDVKPVMSEDPGAASRLFPALAGIESVEMEIQKYGGSHPRDALPSPTDYRYRGYITLSEAAADRYVGTYQFTDAEPDISFEVLERREGQWRYSDEFQKDVLNEGLVGNVWLSGRTLLFDIGTM